MHCIEKSFELSSLQLVLEVLSTLVDLPLDDFARYCAPDDLLFGARFALFVLLPFLLVFLLFLFLFLLFLLAFLFLAEIQGSSANNISDLQ